MQRLTRFALMLGASLAVAQAATPKNIIVFIGDGMGPKQVEAARLYNGEPLSFESSSSFPKQGFCTTASANNLITDSAAAGTAIATGVKVNNDVISVALPGDGRELETMLELFKKRGKATGLITTAYLTHATPAAFGAHDVSRNNTAAIGDDLLTQTQPNVLFGGGANGLDAASAAAYGYAVATDTASFNALNPSAARLCALFGSGYMPYEEDYLAGSYPFPHLTDMVVKALDALDDDPGGFFLMVEAGRIDHACHSNLLPEAVHETLELGRAVEAALTWAAGRTDTLIIVTADHETGGLTVTENNGAGDYPEVTWSTTGHTGVNVPVYAAGPGSEQVANPIPMDNTEFLRLATIEGSASLYVYRVSVQNLTETTADIVWNTDVASSSTVEYRLQGGSDWIAVSGTPDTTVHRVALSGLTSGTPYEFQVTSSYNSVITTSAIYTFTPIAAPPEPLTLVAQGSVWKYEASGTDLGTAWRAPAYDDSSWPQGAAELGYGDGGEKTSLPASPVRPTYYFRHAFNVADPSAYGELSLSLLRDDGAVVYLNGVEVHRVNMPSGDITYATWASSALDYGWDPAVTLANTLVPGLNVLAVEIHQGNATSSDISLDLRLEAKPAPDVIIVSGPAVMNLTDRSAVITWTTDAPAGSRVDYGLDYTDELSVVDNTPVTSHSVTLTGLSAGTAYVYVVTSGNAVSTESTFTTLPANQPPTADPQSVTLDEDSSVGIPLTGSDPDAGQSIILQIVSEPSHGDLTGTPPAVTYTPDLNYAGTDSFTFVAVDSLGLASAPAMVSITVEPKPDAPTAPVATAVAGDSRVDLTWTASIDPDGDTVTYEVYRDGDVDPIATGLDVLQYSDISALNDVTYTYVVRATDVALWADSAPVTATPKAVDPDAYVIDEPTLAAGTVSGGSYTGLAVAGDGAAQTLTEVKIGLYGRVDAQYVLRTVADPASINAADLVVDVDSATTQDEAPWKLFVWDGSAWDSLGNLSAGAQTYTLDPLQYVRSDGTILVAILDEGDIRKEKLDSITIDQLYVDISAGPPPPPNNKPVASGDVLETPEDSSGTVTLSATDDDGPSALTYRVVSGPANGSVSIAGNIATYTPAPDYNGPDSFQFVANDGRDDSDPATVTVTVKAVNDAPVADAQSVSTEVGQPIIITLTGSDADGDPLTYTIAAEPANGDVSIAGNIATYTPNTGYVGSDSFAFTVSEGTASSVPATVSITITDTPTLPQIHVASIGMGLSQAGKNWKATATVTVVDAGGIAFAGATVAGDWTYNGSPIGSASGVTDASGAVVLSSSPMKVRSGDVFTFTLTGVTAVNADYDSGANLVNSASITVP